MDYWKNSYDLCVIIHFQISKTMKRTLPSILFMGSLFFLLTSLSAQTTSNIEGYFVEKNASSGATQPSLYLETAEITYKGGTSFTYFVFHRVCKCPRGGLKYEPIYWGWLELKGTHYELNGWGQSGYKEFNQLGPTMVPIKGTNEFNWYTDDWGGKIVPDPAGKGPAPATVVDPCAKCP